MTRNCDPRTRTKRTQLFRVVSRIVDDFFCHGPARNSDGNNYCHGASALLVSVFRRFMIYRSLLRPLLFRLSPETAHELALSSLSFFLGATPIRKVVAARQRGWPLGPLERCGLEFANPIGLAAGFDKNGTAALGLSALGFEGGPVLFGGLEQVSSRNDSSCDHIRVVGPTTVVIPPGCKP